MLKIETTGLNIGKMMLKIETRRLKIGLTPHPNPVQPVHVCQMDNSYMG